MCPAVPAYVDADVGANFRMSRLKLLSLAHTHASKYFSFFTKKKRNPCECFPCPIFPRLFSLMPKHVNLPSGYFLHMRMLNRFIFPPSSSFLRPEFLSKYLLFDDALHIPARIFHLGSAPCTFRQSPRKKEKKYRIYHYEQRTDLSTSQTIYPFFTRIFSHSSQRVQFKEKFPIIFSPNGCYSTLESSKLNKYMRTWKFAAAVFFLDKKG